MNRNAVWPVILIVVGVIFLAHNLGVLPFAELRVVISTWWPVILIVVGVAALTQKKK